MLLIEVYLELIFAERKKEYLIGKEGLCTG